MTFRPFPALPALAVALLALTRGAAAERNAWPAWVGQLAPAPSLAPGSPPTSLAAPTSPTLPATPTSPAGRTGADGPVQAWQALGPLAFKRPFVTDNGAAVTAAGVRPLYLQLSDAGGRVTEAHLLYPLLTYRARADGYSWSVLNLINRSVVRELPEAPGPLPAGRHEAFDLWPFYFSRRTGAPESSYRALFPLAGSVPHRFGQDRLSWVLFPLYGRFEKRGVTTTTAPWPFLKVMRGEGNHGFELWPLFGRRTKAGAYREQFYLWPLLYKNENALWQSRPAVSRGFLPFYASDRSEGYRSETYVWPFFGYVERTAPYRYHATHYLWPLFVQGRGDQRHVNRWGPFYTHSLIKGTDKRWVLWPLWRQEKWTDAGLHQTKTQLLYFLYHSTRQQSATNTALPAAEKVHLWPLLSAWDNGAGRRQYQVLSPFDVFFPRNDPMRLNYTALFALYRYEAAPGGQSRASLLWDAVTYRRTPATAEFHLGPLLSVDARPAGRRIALGNGLLGLKRAPRDRAWRLFFGEFSRKSAPLAAAAPPP